MSGGFDAELGAQTALAFCREFEWLLKALVSSHPNPRELLKYYQDLAARLDAAEPFSNLPNAALEPAARVRQQVIATLLRIVESQP